MRELLELRVPEEHAHLVFAPNEGQRLSHTRKVTLDTRDPRMARVAEVYAELRSKGEFFFAGWEIRRSYSADELAKAAWFRVRSRYFFEPAGEQCGTTYDQSRECAHCGSGAELVPPLRLNTSRISRNKDFAESIAGELVVSARAAAIIQKEEIKGVALTAVESVGRVGDPWFQLTVTAPRVQVTEPTRWGTNPVDDDTAGQYRCPRGHHPGLNVISEVHFSGGTGDMLMTAQYWGARRGVLRPSEILLVSNRVQRVIRKHRLLGWGFEVAHQSTTH